MSGFANCSGFNESQIITLAALRGGTSAVAAIATIVLLVVTCVCQSRLQFGTEGKWLKVYIFALFGVSICYLTVLSLGVVYHLLPASTGKWCEAFGFLDQVLNVIQITLLFFLIMEVFLSCGHISSEKKWVLRTSQRIILIVAALIVTFSFVPFITGTYGVVGGWCWIVSIQFDEDCEVLVIGLLEQIFLCLIYHALISLICILMALAAVIALLRACIHTYKMGNYRSLDDRHDLKHLFLKYIFQLIILVPIFVDFVDFAHHIHHYSFTLLAFLAVARPINGFLIPLSFLLYIKFGYGKSEDSQPHAQVNQLTRRPNKTHVQVSLPPSEHQLHSEGGTQVEHISHSVIAQGDISTKITTSLTCFTADDDLSWTK